MRILSSVDACRILSSTLEYNVEIIKGSMTRTDQNGFSRPPISSSHNSYSPSNGNDDNMSCLQKISNKIIGTLEDGFAHIGLVIGTYPWRFIIGCIVGAFVCGFGFLSFNEITDPNELWVPKDSQVIADNDWIKDNYPSNVVREQMIALGSGGNILTRDSLMALLDIYDQSLTISSSSGVVLSDVCVKAGSDCTVYGILEVWSFNRTVISALTKNQILLDIKTTNSSPTYGNAIDYKNYLGSISWDSNDDISAAQAALMTWLADGTESVKSTTESWENAFIDLGLRGHSSLSNLYVFAGRTWPDVTGDAIDGDVVLLSAGYFLVVVFVLLVLGKFNFVEQRIWLTLGGFICIGLSILVSIGLSSAFQQGYGPLQSVLPFLLLGVGVDDMFVIVSSFNNLTPEDNALDIPQKVSKILRHAGVSITITSFTDFVAFMIGATTIIPALRSFCIYAGIGIVGLYIFQALFFTSCLALDLKRISQNRDGCCCMIKHGDDYTPNQCSQKQLASYVFKKGLARIITKVPFKIAVVCVGLGLFGFNLYNFIQLEQYFDPNWFVPSDTYARKYLSARDTYFPEDGADGFVYCGTLDYWSKQTNFENLDSTLQSSSYIKNGTTDSWFNSLTTWLSETNDGSIIAMLDGNRYPSTNANFENLTYRMRTEQVTRTNAYLKFDTSYDIAASRFPFRHISMSDAATEIKAMENTRDIVKNAGFSTSECFPFSIFYFTWETNKIIQEELYRNLGLALICVFLVTLILIANFFTSIIVLFGVAATLIDVAGSMHLWNLTIDTVSSIVLILSIGLAVDYSAHIGHMFMTVKGSRNDRVKETVGEMGPPVFYGGFSTFLAFVLLSNSNSYVFTTFFKVNFMVVVYGLFHGLIFIPVVLSWFGPKPYATADREYKHHDNKTVGAKSDAETGEGVANPAFDSHEMKPNGKYNDLPQISLGSIDPMATNKNGSLAGSTSPPPSQGFSKSNSPPPDYTSQTADSFSLPTVQN